MLILVFFCSACVRSQAVTNDVNRINSNSSRQTICKASFIAFPCLTVGLVVAHVVIIASQISRGGLDQGWTLDLLEW